MERVHIEAKEKGYTNVGMDSVGGTDPVTSTTDEVMKCYTGVSVPEHLGEGIPLGGMNDIRRNIKQN